MTQWRRRSLVLLATLVAVYLLAAYVLMPLLWKRYDRRHPSLENIPGIAYAADGVPGDPLNVALVGTRHELIGILLAAKWDPADALSFKSCLEIAEATVLKRPYDEAPVSSLYLFGRKEDLAFEQPVGPDPRKRHHVRFWKSDKLDPDGRPMWMGSVTYDERVGLSDRTGQITHHIGPDVDAERDRLFDQLRATGKLVETSEVPDFHKVREGRNGGGDPWRTDGKLYVGVIAANAG